MKKLKILIFILVASTSCNAQSKVEDEWSKKLTKEQYYILRQKGN